MTLQCTAGISASQSTQITNDRYWVGGTASWDGTATNKWAYVSGGLPLAQEPTSSNDVYIDHNSGVGTITVATSTRSCKSLNFTGFTGTFAGSTGLNVSGSLTLGAGMTRTYTGLLTLNSTLTGNLITSNGITLGGQITFNGVGGGWLLNDNFSSTGLMVLTNGSLDFNNYNVTISGFSASSTNLCPLNLRSGVITLTGDTNTWATSASSLTLNAGTSTIKVTTTTPGSNNFAGSGFTYYNFENASNQNHTITGNNTFNNIKLNPNSKQRFFAGSVNTFSTLDATGTAGNVITISNATTNYTLVSNSGTAINTDYVTISRCQFSGATWHAGANSTDGGNNTGILFP